MDADTRPQDATVPEGFNWVELDMIKRGDMIGSQLGEKTYAAISDLAALRAELAEKNAQVEALTKALEPFATSATGFDHGKKKVIPDILHVLPDLTVGDLRFARATLARIKGQPVGNIP